MAVRDRAVAGRVVGAMTTTVRAALIAGLIVAATVAMRWVNPLTTIGDIKSDEATYVSMALSIVHDGNLTFEKADLDRFVAIYPRGPEGIFLKRQYQLHPSVNAAWPLVHLNRSAVPTSERLVYGKSFAYPLAAAPFVVMGGVSGLLVFNGLLLAVCLAGAVRFAQAQTGRVAGAVFGVAFFAASVIPVYLVWFMPEVFNVALIFGAYFLWLYKEVAPPTAWNGWRGRWTDVAAAALVGVATYSKPSHAVLILPMLLAALARLEWRRAVVVGAVSCVVGGGLFAANVVVAGDAIYQGAIADDGRKEFYGEFPFDAKGSTYDGYHKADKVTNDFGNENTTTGDVLFRLLPINTWYFIVGRDAGLLPFFFPGLLIVVAWLLRIRRTTAWQTATALGAIAAMGAWLIIAPYTWNGAGGPPGNRYILSTYPLLLFLVPRGLSLVESIAAIVVGSLFTGPMLASPLLASYEPWLTVERQPFPMLPVELTMPLDLPVALLPGKRSKIEVVKEPEVLFTYLDENAYSLEPAPNPAPGELPDRQWIAGNATADILIRTEQPLRKLTLTISDKYVPNDVKVTLMGHTQRAHLEPGGTATLAFTPKPGQWAHASWAVMLRISTSNGFVPAKVEPAPPGQQPDTRFLGVFVKYAFEVAEKPPGG